MADDSPPAANPQHPPVEGAESALGDVRESQELEALRAELAAAREERDAARRERDDALGKMQRALADFDNFRKRTRGDAQAAREKAKEDVMRALLDVLDNFDRALAAPPEGLAEGVRLIHRQLAALLEREGLSRIDAVGEAFDATRHEAIARVATKDAKEGVVVEEVARGYALNGKVVRPARVKVAAPPE